MPSDDPGAPREPSDAEEHGRDTVAPDDSAKGVDSPAVAPNPFDELEPAGPMPDAALSGGEDHETTVATSPKGEPAADDDDGDDRPPSPAPTPELPNLSVHVPNATVGKPYFAEVSTGLSAELPDGLEIRVSGMEQAGLASKVEDGGITLFGTPTQQGEFTLTVTLVLPKTDARPEVAKEHPGRLLVNPDPRSLWKEQEPDPSLPYHKPHVACDRVVGNSVMIAASRRGRSHAHEGTFRDDEFLLRRLENSDWYLMVVADGAGSAKFSRRGSQIACEVICDTITPHFEPAGTLGSEFETLVQAHASQPSEESKKRIGNALYTTVGGSAMAAYKEIEKETAEQDGADIRDFSTTLVFTASKKFSFGWFIAAYAVGDGGAGIYSTEGVTLLNDPDGGEFAGQTRFLTMSEIWGGSEILARIRFEIAEEFVALVAMTDGVSDPMFPTENNFRDDDMWHEFWKGINEEVSFDKANDQSHEQLAEWLNFWSKGNHDDRTIAVLIP